MNRYRRLLVLSFFAPMVGCGSEVKTSSGAGSENVCNDCTNIIIRNNTTFPLVITGSGRAALLHPNQSLTFKYKRIDSGENVILGAQRANSTGAAIGPAIEENFHLRGGRTYSWLVESDDFNR